MNKVPSAYFISFPFGNLVGREYSCSVSPCTVTTKIFRQQIEINTQDINKTCNHRYIINMSILYYI